LCGERSKFAESEFRVRGGAVRSPHTRNLWEEPLTPTLSPQERGEGEFKTSLRAARPSSFSSAARPRPESLSAAPAARRYRPIPATARLRRDRAVAGQCGLRAA